MIGGAASCARAACVQGRASRKSAAAFMREVFNACLLFKG
jgi:hypothetical protein